MQFTVSSRGRPIGVTDLGFVRIGGPSRSGWFHPNADGDRLMPVIASVLPAMRAYLHKDVLDEDGRPIVQPQLPDSTLFADLAEALHQAGTLELTLHREDGSLVPTTHVGIQDTERLLAIAEWDDACCDARSDARRLELDGAPPDEALDEALDDDVDLTDLVADAPPWSDVDDGFGAWEPDGQPVAFPRYQIHVMLADAHAVP